MGLFDMFKKKNCDICGSEIGLLGNRKLEDGNCCKNCAAKLSRWFDERRHSTVAQIKDQLAYREANEAAVKAFHATKVIGENYLVYIDENSRRFFVAQCENYLAENPDILSFDDILSCELKIDEDQTEIMRETKDSEGNTKEVSYNPKRYLFEYDFNMIIRVRNPYFDDMRFRLNNRTLELETNANHGRLVNFSAGHIDPTRDMDYRRYASMGEEIVQILMAAPDPVKEEPAAPVQSEPVVAGPKFCPNCGAPAEGGKFCQYCGAKF